jgi:hypothetical protein
MSNGRVFNDFHPRHNREAPGGALPSDLQRLSSRPCPRRLEPITYPDHFEVRRVSGKGGIK